MRRKLDLLDIVVLTEIEHLYRAFCRSDGSSDDLVPSHVERAVEANFCGDVGRDPSAGANHRLHTLFG
jgi:hypothetical protein